MKKNNVPKKNICTRALFFGFFFMNVHCSEHKTILSTIPTIEVMPSQGNSTAIAIPRLNDEEPATHWIRGVFEAAINNNLFPNIIQYSPDKRDIILHVTRALAIFKATINANKEAYFKECAYLYETLFPPRSASPLRRINVNNSPQPGSPVHSRRGSESSLYNRFSVDSDLVETPKECLLKNDTQKNIFASIIAHCMVTLHPNMLTTLCENIKNNIIHQKHLKKPHGKKHKHFTDQSEHDALIEAEKNYKMLEEKYTTLQQNQSTLEKTLETYSQTITALEQAAKLQKETKSNNNATNTSNEQEKSSTLNQEVLALQKQVGELNNIIANQKKDINAYKSIRQENIDAFNNKIDILQKQVGELESNITTQEKSVDALKNDKKVAEEKVQSTEDTVKMYRSTAKMYRMASGIGAATSLLLCIILLYQNKLLPQWPASGFFVH